MNINESISNFIQIIPQLTTSYCIVNGAFMSLDEVNRMGYEEFSIRSKINMPTKLYKYFPNVIKKEDDKEVNYSIQALKNNTVFMQAPSEFDDVYDSDINIDYSTYEKLRLIEYCRRCQIDVNENTSVQEIGGAFVTVLLKSYNETGNFHATFTTQQESEIIKLSNKLFCKRLSQQLSINNNIGEAVIKVVHLDYNDYFSQLKNTFRTSCFATTPYSQLMWGGSYADCHRGFCLEYTVLPNAEQYKSVYLNLFPMIYCKFRPDMTERLTKMQEHEMTIDGMWDIYFHGALRKSIDWAYQNEWRLLMVMNSKVKENYNVDFFPITKVFLGNRMPNEKRREIIEVCKEKNIPYTGVMRNSSVFEMQDCPIKCEDCPKYLNENP